MAQGLAKGKEPVAPGNDDMFVTAVNRLSSWASQNTRTLLVGLGAIGIGAIGTWYYVNFTSSVEEQAAADLALLRMSAATPELLIPDFEAYVLRFEGTASADEARLSLARLHLDADRAADAVLVAGAVGVDPDRPVGFAARQLLAAAQEANGDVEGALATFQELGAEARFAFQRRQSRASAGRLLVGLGRFDEAAVLYEALAEEAEEEDPAEAGVYRLRLGEVKGARASSDGA